MSHLKIKTMRKKEIIKLYDKKYFEERNFLISSYVNVIDNLLAEHKIKNVLDVGVGSGLLMKYLKKRGYDVQGIDISPESAKISGAIIASATKIPFKKNEFDCVLGISIIEHLTQKEGIKFVKEINRVLKPKGIVFLITPNYASPLRYVRGNNWYGYSDRSHIFFYTPRSLRKLLLDNNFEHIRLKFKITISELEWPLPSYFHKLPDWCKYIINYLFVSTPFALIRDSVWISGRKVK